ncbi:hypothetical protein A4X06_0g8640 [Tilletia controversa]|uniref:Uncharacterized protein n=2 Tax=Tilletia TaxID=13289 RepID=A0A8X7SSZ6_9BASI|nr:hypothetical protein A4X06_0g8640 [Tilletia controversa]
MHMHGSSRGYSLFMSTAATEGVRLWDLNYGSLCLVNRLALQTLLTVAGPPTDPSQQQAYDTCHCQQMLTIALWQSSQTAHPLNTPQGPSISPALLTPPLETGAGNNGVFMPAIWTDNNTIATPADQDPAQTTDWSLASAPQAQPLATISDVTVMALVFNDYPQGLLMTSIVRRTREVLQLPISEADKDRVQRFIASFGKSFNSDRIIQAMSVWFNIEICFLRGERSEVLRPGIRIATLGSPFFFSPQRPLRYFLNPPSLLP